LDVISTEVPEGVNNVISPPTQRLTKNQDITPFKYLVGTRDPFSQIKEESPRKLKPAGPPPPAWAPPPLHLVGITISPKKRIATVEDELGGTHFLTEGDTLSGVRVLRIHDQSVSYRYRSRTTEWVLADPKS
jgi:hypothetical protein